MRCPERTVLVLGCASTTPHGRDQMRRVDGQLRRRRIRLVGADTVMNLRTARNLPSMVCAALDEVVELDVHDPGACRNWAAGRSDFDAVFTFREMCVESAAAAAAELGLTGNDPHAVHTIRTKDLCRDRLRAAGFRQPACTIAADVAEAARFLAETSPGPWIVKPRTGMGSIGVSRVDHSGQLAAAVERLDGSSPFLVETFVAGPELSAEGVLINGVPVVLALTAKRTAAGFVEVGHRMPAALEPAVAATARAEVERALTVMGITRGIFHVELWLDPEGVVLGEIHARPGGDFLHAMVEHTRPGLELYGMLVDDLLGATQAPVPEQSAAAGAEFLLLPPGTVRVVYGWDTVRADDAIIAADLSVRGGDQIRAVRSSTDRHGVLVVGGTSGEVVAATLDRLLAALHVEVR